MSSNRDSLDPARLERLVAGEVPVGEQERSVAELFELARESAAAPTHRRAEGGHTEDHFGWSEERRARLRGRILARTTQADLSWRGELSFRTRLLRQSLRERPLLRIVAASLLLHLIGLPAFAFYLVQRERPRPEPEIRFEVAKEAWPALDESPEFADPNRSNDVSLADVDPAQVRPSEVEDALRRARFLLSTAHGPALPSDPGAAPELVWLRRRVAFLGDRSWAAALDSRSEWEASSLPARILWAEVLLDRYALVGERPKLLARALSSLAGEDSEAPGIASGIESVLHRASAYGVWQAPAGFQAASAPLPLGREEFEALRGALGGVELRVSPVWEAYQDWQRIR